MYSKILKYLSGKPKVYSPSTSAFWDDAHISKYMLEAHLAPEVESASRKLSFIQKSVDWIANMCNRQEKKNLLDLGCGPGIYAELFYKASFNVTGIDFSKRSIEYATQSATENQMQINYIYQNYLEINYDNIFDVVTLVYCDFGVLSPVDRQLLLKKIKKALKKDGVLILDGFTNLNLNNFSERQSIKYHDNGFWSDKPHVCIENSYLYFDTQNYLEQYTIITSDDCQCYNVWNQVFNADSLSSELKTAGFENIEFFDDVCGTELSNNSTTICAVAKCQ